MLCSFHALLSYGSIGTHNNRGCHEDGEWGKRGANKIASPWRKCDTPIMWPVENGEWRMGITRELACGKNLCYAQPRPPPQIKHIDPPTVKEATPSEEPSHNKFSPFSILHSWMIRMYFSIFREWALLLSRRACHVPILWGLRMERKRCDNP